MYGICEILPNVHILSEDASAAHDAFKLADGDGSWDGSNEGDSDDEKSKHLANSVHTSTSDEDDKDAARRKPLDIESPTSAEKKKKKVCLKKTKPAKPGAKKADKGREAPEEEISVVLDHIRALQ